MKNLAIIPARSGSKGLKNKNIKLLNGIPLMAYSIKAAQESGMFDEIMVSTDSEQYEEIAQEYGADTPFLREKYLSGDSVLIWDVVLDVLYKYRREKKHFDTICILQPTSPLRGASYIIDGYDLLKSKHADAVTSVCEAEHSPLWCMALDSDCSLSDFRNGLQELPRQQLPQYYRLNGAIYIRKVVYNGEDIKLCYKNEVALIMPQAKSIDIDTEIDFKLAEFFINK